MFYILGQLIQKIIDIIGVALTTITNIFPDSPFNYIDASGFGDILSKINYFVPIYTFVAIGETWLIAITLYYLGSIFARWIKAIE